MYLHSLQHQFCIFTSLPLSNMMLILDDCTAWGSGICKFFSAVSHSSPFCLTVAYACLFPHLCSRRSAMSTPTRTSSSTQPSFFCVAHQLLTPSSGFTSHCESCSASTTWLKTMWGWRESCTKVHRGRQDCVCFSSWASLSWAVCSNLSWGTTSLLSHHKRG